MTILLIDNDRNEQETFREVIRRIDPAYKFVKYFSTESALESLLEKDCELPDLIFLDLVFRANGGKHMLKALKGSKTLRGIPVCIYAALTNESDRDETRNLGAIDYIVKQQNLTSLAESIKAVIASRH